MSISSSRLWRSIGFGALGFLVFAPIGLSPFLLVIFWGVVSIQQELHTPKEGFFYGYVFGAAYFLSHLWWVGKAVGTYGLPYLVVPVSILLCLYLALYPATACWLCFWYRHHDRQNFASLRPMGKFPCSLYPLLLAVSFSLCEWGRGHFFTGFPWNLVGYSLDLGLLQHARGLGIYLLSFLVVLLFLYMAKGRKREQWWALGAVVFLWGWGWAYQHTHPTRYLKVSVRLVQPCIVQQCKWNRQFFMDHLRCMVALSRRPPSGCITHGSLTQQPTFIVWPEAAIICDVRGGDLMDMLRYAGRYESYLITGSIRYEYAKPGRPNKIFDHVSLIHPNGTIMGAYDKHHLVPFGEYMPFRFLGLGKLTHGSLDYSPGKGNQTITVPGGTSFSPLVCYEIVFPGKMVATDAPRPQWILNLTNDAWFGRSFGPYQHLRIAQVRAIEEKMAVVRCSNNGISGVVDPCGRIVASLGLDEMGVVDHYIPAPLD